MGPVSFSALAQLKMCTEAGLTVDVGDRRCPGALFLSGRWQARSTFLIELVVRCLLLLFTC